MGFFCSIGGVFLFQFCVKATCGRFVKVKTVKQEPAISLFLKKDIHMVNIMSLSLSLVKHLDKIVHQRWNCVNNFLLEQERFLQLCFGLFKSSVTACDNTRYCCTQKNYILWAKPCISCQRMSDFIKELRKVSVAQS